MKIQITTQDFRNATCYTDSRHCPLVQAVRRNLNIQDENVIVSCSIGYLQIGENHYNVTLDWCDDQMLYKGEFEGMSIDDMITMAKSDPNVEFPTIELILEENENTTLSTRN